MKNNRPKSTTARDEKHPQHWYDLGYEDASFDFRGLNTHDKGWMEARDDMEGVMEIVHFCLEKDRPNFAKTIIEKYINCKGKKHE